MKPPSQPKIKVEEVFSSSESDRQVVKNIKQILTESEVMLQYKPLIRDRNSISSILTTLRQQIEQRKIFGAQNI